MATIDDVYAQIESLIYTITGGAGGTTGEIQSAGTDFLGDLHTDIHDGSGPIVSVIRDTATQVGVGGDPFAAQIWQPEAYTFSGGGEHQKMGRLLSDAGSFAQQASQQMAWRPFLAPHFHITGIGGTGSLYTSFHFLDDCWPGANLTGESDLDMLTRLHPEIDWVQDKWTPGAVGAGYVDDQYNTYLLEYRPLPGGAPTAAQVAEAVGTRANPLLEGTEYEGTTNDGIMATVLAGALASQRIELHRYAGLPDWLLSGGGINETGAGTPIADFELPALSAVDAEEQQLGESDLAFLNRVAGTFTWVSPFTGGQHPYTEIVDPVSGHQIIAMYAPIRRWKDEGRLFTYTPSSGLPKRSVMGELAFIMALIPIDYSAE